jgi:hypothetical protein
VVNVDTIEEIEDLILVDGVTWYTCNNPMLGKESVVYEYGVVELLWML